MNMTSSLAEIVLANMMTDYDREHPLAENLGVASLIEFGERPIAIVVASVNATLMFVTC